MSFPCKILFDPIRLGSVVALYRFHNVSLWFAKDHMRPMAKAAVRETKSEESWGVISTQETEINQSLDLTSYAEGRLFDAYVIPALRVMTGVVHEHCALAENLELIGDVTSSGLAGDSVCSEHFAVRSVKEDPQAIEKALFEREKNISLEG